MVKMKDFGLKKKYIFQSFDQMWENMYGRKEYEQKTQSVVVVRMRFCSVVKSGLVVFMGCRARRMIRRVWLRNLDFFLGYYYSWDLTFWTKWDLAWRKDKILIFVILVIICLIFLIFNLLVAFLYIIYGWNLIKLSASSQWYTHLIWWFVDSMKCDPGLICNLLNALRCLGHICMWYWRLYTGFGPTLRARIKRTKINF